VGRIANPTYIFVYNMRMAEIRPALSPTVRAHRRQFVWQILVPICLVVLLGLVAGAFIIATAVSHPSVTRLGADVSIIWLIAPLLVLALLVAAILVFAIVGLAKLMQITPRYTGRAQSIAFVVADWARRVANWIVAPFGWFEQARAALKSFFGR